MVMVNKTTNILILGGYGVTGSMIANLLLQESEVKLVLAGRSMEKAQAKAAELNSLFPGNRVMGAYADASNEATLKTLFESVDLVIVASSTSAYARQIARSAIQSGIDYLDIQYSSSKLQTLHSLEREIVDAGCCFITDGGFHPGLAALLVRFMAKEFDEIEVANVGSLIKIDWASMNFAEATIQELVEELKSFDTAYYSNGKWKKGGSIDQRVMDFGRIFGRQLCTPMHLHEMDELPTRYPTLKETGFFVGGFNWFVDWVVIPIAFCAFYLNADRLTKKMGSFMNWGLVTFSKPPYGTMLKIEASGWKDNEQITKELTYYHSDGYMLTAISVVACILQYLDGSIKKPGLWTQANLVQPEQMVTDLIKMGVSRL